MDRHLIIKNGKVITMGIPQQAEWIYVSLGKIADMGDGDGYRKYRGDNVREVDAKGGTVLPGFIDNHFHIINSSLYENYVDLSDAETLSDVGRKILSALDEEGESLVADGLDTNKVDEGRLPNRLEIDKFCDSKPVIIYSKDYHAIALNTYAILYYKVPFASNGVGLDEKGMPTGIFMNQAAARLEERIMDVYSDQDFNRAIEMFIPKIFSNGITTIAAMEGGNHLAGHGRDRQSDYICKRKKDYPLSIHPFYQSTDIDRVLESNASGIGGALYIDGTLGTWGAYLSYDYADFPNNRGKKFFTDEYIKSFVMECCKNGLQIGFDAIGDGAIDVILDSLDRAANYYDVVSMRHRIEHGELIRPDQMERAARLGVILSMQPGYEGLWGSPGGMYEKRLGSHYGETNRLRMILDKGLFVCGGSDCSVTDMNPMLGIHWAVNHPVKDNKITLMEALKIYTLNGAYALFLEKDKGSIEKGKTADIAVLDRDITAIASEELKDTKVQCTIKDGEVIYERSL